MALNARDHLLTLVGLEIRTPGGMPNRVLRIHGDDVIVATSRSPAGKAVPIQWVQDAMDMLEADGGVTIDVETVGYRSAFIGAVLATVPGAIVLPTSPPRIELRD
jgi:hypothetical protein